ncbi:hypothetical protein [Pontibacter beigongshangensis]|uniref:hypothetical protein n=1 Tax=Pontibacter beigongshangensis TaxID=2574733 RepID=UPI001650214E|nr:hypothetical protein [Pontibacter beigongshangensis]
MKILYRLLLLLGVFTACNKEEVAPELQYPSTYASKNMHNTTSVRMYTSNGEVKDAAVISAFLQKNTQLTPFYHLKDKAIETGGAEKLTFLNAQEAELVSGTNTQRFNIAKNGLELILTNQQETTGTYNRESEAFADFTYAISKYKPIVYDKVAMPLQDISYFYKTKSQIFITLKKNEAHFHRLAVTLKRGTKEAYRFNTLRYNNQFDPTGLSLLRNTDTLIVQEFVVVAAKE